VDQLIREGQDWIFRDQTQLANGFENWNPNLGSVDDIAGWFAGVQSPGGGGFSAGVGAGGVQMNGGPVGGAAQGNGYANGNGVVNVSAGPGMSGIGGLAPGFNTYDEGSWYDYQ